MINNNKYNYPFEKNAMIQNVNRLTNQLWKLIPMRENNENWNYHLKGLIVEISGLNEILFNQQSFISLLSKLEGLVCTETDFMLYRKIVFESISLLREVIK